MLGGGVEGATVIDPADDQHEHLEAIIRAGAMRGDIRRILITHGHADHMGGALALREMLGVHIYAASREGVPFADYELPDGMLIPAGDECLRVIKTPGHRFDHLCFLLESSRILFAGDLMAGTGTVVMMPPEGDLLDYLASLRRLQQLHLREIVPAHGPVINDPQVRLAEYIAHRMQREEQIISTLRGEPAGLTILDHCAADLCRCRSSLTHCRGAIGPGPSAQAGTRRACMQARAGQVDACVVNAYVVKVKLLVRIVIDYPGLSA